MSEPTGPWGSEQDAGHGSEQGATASQPTGRPVGHEGARVEISERPARSWGTAGGVLTLLASLGALGGAVWLIVLAAGGARPVWLLVTGAVAAVIGSFVLMGMVAVISPGQTRVVQLFGRYIGTVRRTGLAVTAPLSSRHTVSIRVRNFETNELKVNDADGNPIHIAAIIVWQVADTAKATFAVEGYKDFVRVQAESALRHVAMSHPYDNAQVGEESLRGATDAVSAEIAAEVAARVAIAGVEVVEARISHLAYAPEIAQAMLRRQQAGAIIAAREQIMEGAVSIVESALERLERESVVALDDERRAAMVSNLLVVLCGDSRPTPVLNTGSLYT